MEPHEIKKGALNLEAVANRRMCQDMLGQHLCFATRDRRFREAFGISSESAFMLWIYLNVPNEGPEGGRQVHMLWTLMFLKTYGMQNDLAGRCGVHRDTFRAWRNLFLERMASINDELVSVACCCVLVRNCCFCFLTISPIIRSTLTTDTCLQIQTKFAKSRWMAQTFGSMNHHHSTQSGIRTRSMDQQLGMKLPFASRRAG